MSSALEKDINNLTSFVRLMDIFSFVNNENFGGAWREIVRTRWQKKKKANFILKQSTVCGIGHLKRPHVRKISSEVSQGYSSKSLSVLLTFNAPS